MFHGEVSVETIKMIKINTLKNLSLHSFRHYLSPEKDSNVKTKHSSLSCAIEVQCFYNCKQIKIYEVLLGVMKLARTCFPNPAVFASQYLNYTLEFLKSSLTCQNASVPEQTVSYSDDVTHLVYILCRTEVKTRVHSDMKMSLAISARLPAIVTPTGRNPGFRHHDTVLKACCC